jgi:2-polyprenyl-6-methoxyphenol hydroxylase-like FAD-dependent oxidoreductase
MLQTSSDRDRFVGNRTLVGNQAVVVGAGIAGLAAAAALSDWFARVIVLERDRLSDWPAHRIGTPQARHPHGLLFGGLHALGQLLPGLDKDFFQAGGVPVRINQDLREELPNGEAMPQRDFGRVAYTMTRPLIETTLRQRILQRGNITLREGTRALNLMADPAGRRVTAVECTRGEDNRSETIPADLVIDASGRGQLTTILLQSIGRSLPQQTTISMDLGYSTALMDIPDNAPSDWKIALTHSRPPHSSRRAIVLPVEGNRWIMAVVGFGGDRPPAEWDELLAFLRELNTRTIHDAVKHTRPIDKVVQFGFPASVWRHFERLQDFPDGLVPVGDALCRFNPVYGQGMTVAAKEAVLLHQVLATRAAEHQSLAGLGLSFFAEAKSLIATAWTMAAIPDLAFPSTRGDRPTDLKQSLQFSRGLSRLAVRDETVQRLLVEVWHMMTPRNALREPQLVRRVEAEIADMVGA